MKYEILEISNKIKVLLENLRGFVWKKTNKNWIRENWEKLAKSGKLGRF